MTPAAAVMLHLGGAIAAGGVIGWERSYLGRAAGLRTHVLVALACATALVIGAEPARVIDAFPQGAVRMDPSRIIQGLMTGVGFLGAGVIVKEGVSIYGLTNAASIWMSAALGVVFGLGYAAEGVLATAATLVVVVGLRQVEMRAPRQVYALARLRFAGPAQPSPAEITAWLAQRGVRLHHFSYRKLESGAREVSGTVQVRREADFMQLEAALQDWAGLTEYDFARNNK